MVELGSARLDGTGPGVIDDAFTDAEGSGDPPATEGTSVTSAEPMCPQCALVA
jgi:hypothetical protein